MELKLESNKPKGGMNISKKEKSLLLLLAMVTILWLFHKYVMTPQEAEIQRLRAEKANYEKELMRIQEILSREKMIKSEYDSLLAEYGKAAGKYYSGAEQPELMHMINGIADSSKLKIQSISFREPEAAEMEGIDAKLSGVSLAYRGSFSDLENLLSQLRNSPQRLLIEQLSLQREGEGMLNGQLSFNAIAFGGREDKKDGYFYTNGYGAQSKADPFEAFKDYMEVTEGYDGAGGLEKRILLSDLESDAVYYMSTGQGTTGTVERTSGGRFGSTSIRAEYYISTGYQPERAYVVLDDQDINIKYPPPSIGIWAYSYGYSPVTVGMRFQDPEGEKIDLKLSEGVNWVGWKYISAAPPQDVNIYPLKLDRVYMELGPDKDDYGVLLFDRIEAGYPESGENAGNPDSFEFYVVRPGDTLAGISEMFYGTRSQYTRIMKDNGLAGDSALEAGRVLVIRK
ncbi:MAG: LysM domain-containing protein [Clostridiaceae bacterium]|jgi:type IV pilus assembly protein PilO|nr:LysM domain-containing protein [Clostridiaceae bacterium]